MDSAIINFKRAWRTYLLEWRMARNYHFPYLLNNSPEIPNPLIDKILPSLLFMRVTSIFDEGLELYIKTESITMPRKKYRKDLNGRISVLSDLGVLENSNTLHNIRDRRNVVAHEKNSNVGWNQLSQDISEIEKTLQILNLIGERPHLECYGERSPIRWLDNHPEIAGTETLCFGVKENGISAFEFSWEVTIKKK